MLVVKRVFVAILEFVVSEKRLGPRRALPDKNWRAGGGVLLDPDDHV